MPHRRAPRWVVWPAKLLWAPLLLAGLWSTIAVDVDSSKLEDGTWRILASFPTPAHWADDLVSFIIGISMLLVGTVLAGLYFWRPGPGRRMTLVEYPLFSLAAWIFLVVTVLAAFRLEDHIVEFGQAGIDWRFLVHSRDTAVDRVLMVCSAVAGALCWAMGWGLVSGRRAAAPPDA